MRLSGILSLPVAILPTVYALSSISPYSESLHLKPLPDGNLYAGFHFTASTPLAAYSDQHFRFFPRSLGQILQHTHATELHLRFALGRWDDEIWGSRPRSGRKEGGTGVELWAWIDSEEDNNEEQISQRWSALVNSLSGLFCASLNFVDETKTTRPILSFEPEGDTKLGNGSRSLRHGMLPHEVVCTENLTPFLKLLPCKGKAGVSSLLDGHKVFDATWQTMAIDVRSICNGTDQCDLEIEQTVDMVLDIERSMRPRDNPIPRPLPIEEITCDTTKGYDSDDTCFPKRIDGEMGWSLSGIFGRPIHGSCPVVEGSQPTNVLLEVPASREVKASLEALRSTNQSRSYSLNDHEEFDLDLPQQILREFGPQSESSSLVSATRQITGYGQERGGMHITITNPQPFRQRTVYLESLPWFLRPYIHTLKVSSASIDKMYFTPAIDRKRGTHLELLLDVAANSVVEMTYDFEKAILRYTEYPPDANRGFDVPPAILRILPTNGSEDSQGSYLRTTSLLLPLPTPDFSMPYNVIILTSTVIALGFGSIFNLLIRRFVLLEEVPKSPITAMVHNTVARVQARLKKTNCEVVANSKPETVHTEKSSDRTQDNVSARLQSRKASVRLEEVNGGIDAIIAGR